MPLDVATLYPTTRFSDRVENYVKYRPSYPEQIVPFLENTIGLHKECRIVDIGSGTGNFSELFLKAGYAVTGIEPNENMRKAAEDKLSGYAAFSSRNRQAEQTGLRSQSVDLITVAQAFHWMDAEKTKKEFFRILKPSGHIVLAWNLRLNNTPFLKGYEALKEKFSIDNPGIERVNDTSIQQLYAPKMPIIHRFSNVQWLNFESLKGQLLSASYIPLPGHPQYELMISELADLFVASNERGLIKMEFETKIFVNR
jgi:ubiquinone/menaquinone biosynthesis C-methylase UbiE